MHAVDPSAPAAGANLLSPEEEALASRFRFEKDARHWRACRSALREILGRTLGIPPAEVALYPGEHGKPLLREPHAYLHFNLSHCHDLALIAVSVEGPVGIDIEAADRGKSLLGCEASFCHAEELGGLPAGEEDRARTLLELWTGKEALLKALGTGMSLAPETVSLCGEKRHPRLEGFRLRRLDHAALAGHVAHLAVPAGVEKVEFAGRTSTAGPGSWQ